MTRDFPPGPRFGLLQSFLYVRDTPGYHLRSARRFGDPFSAPTLFGDRIVFTGRPAGIEALSKAPPGTFEPWKPEILSPALGEHSLMLLDAKSHRRERRLMSPAFHGNRIRAYGEVIRSIAARHIDRWPAARRVRIHDAMMAISLEVMVRAVLGISEESRVEEFVSVMVRFARAATPLVLFAPAFRVDLGRYSPWGRFLAARDALDRLLYQEIDRRSRMPDSAALDILSLLTRERDEEGASLTREELRDELRTLLIAGHETTATSLAWAFYWIHSVPGVLETLRSEIDRMGDPPAPERIVESSYLDAACQETLRIRPIITDVARRTTVPFDLLGYPLPTGTPVSYSVVLAHANPESFPEPDRFRPERFLGTRPSPYQFIPFGLGEHRCLGAAFSLYEMKLVIGTAIQKVSLVLRNPRPEKGKRRQVTIGPASGVWVDVESRTPRCQASAGALGR